MGQYRIQRLNDQLRDEISQLIMRGEVKDPRVNTFLSVNRVEVTNDLSYAKAYVSTFLTDNQLRVGVDGLNAAAGFIQREIAKKLRIRQFPKLQFVVDSGMKKGFEMVQKLNELTEELDRNTLKDFEWVSLLLEKTGLIEYYRKVDEKENKAENSRCDNLDELIRAFGESKIEYDPNIDFPQTEDILNQEEISGRENKAR